jgi:hypothetical protein
MRKDDYKSKLSHSKIHHKGDSQLSRKNNQYRLDYAIKFLQITSTHVITGMIIIVSLAFLFVFGKYIFYLTFYNTYDFKTEQILRSILDWCFKIVIGWLLKQAFDKK